MTLSRMKSIQRTGIMPRRMFETMRRNANSSEILYGGGTSTVFRGPNGTSLAHDPRQEIPVFMLRPDVGPPPTEEFPPEDGFLPHVFLRAKPALIERDICTLQDGTKRFMDEDLCLSEGGSWKRGRGWHMQEGDQGIIIGEPWPGLSADDFEPFYIQDNDKLTPGDQAIVFLDGYFRPHVPGSVSRWVFLYGMTADGVATVKTAFRTESGAWTVRTPDPEPDTLAAFHYDVTVAPNYTPEHFAAFGVGVMGRGGIDSIPFQIDHNTLPSGIDIACRMESGFLVPDYRMLAVAPAGVEELCEPCGSGLPSSSLPSTASGDCGCGG